MQGSTRLEHYRSSLIVVPMFVVSVILPIFTPLTNSQNQELLDDKLYLGLRRPRVRGKEYDEFVDTFVQSAHKLYPKAYIHL